MYLNFSNFWGRTLAEGDKPWSKNGDKCQMGGPPVPPEKSCILLLVQQERERERERESLFVTLFDCQKWLHTGS